MERRLCHHHARIFAGDANLERCWLTASALARTSRFANITAALQWKGNRDWRIQLTKVFRSLEEVERAGFGEGACRAMHGTLNRLIDAYAASDQYAPDGGYVVLLERCETIEEIPDVTIPNRNMGISRSPIRASRASEERA